jgi:hypothetical protein
VGINGTNEHNILDALAPRGEADLVRDYAMPVSAEALKLITGLTNMAAPEMDRVSQGMIDGCANYAGDPQVEAHCHDCTASIDRHIDAMLPRLRAAPDLSAISVMDRAGLGGPTASRPTPSSSSPAARTSRATPSRARPGRC